MGGACSTHGEGTEEVHRGFCWRNLKESDHFENRGVDGCIILNGSSGNGMRRHGLDLSGSGCGQVVANCEYGNEPSGSIKCGEFLD